MPLLLEVIPVTLCLQAPVALLCPHWLLLGFSTSEMSLTAVSLCRIRQRKTDRCMQGDVGAGTWVCGVCGGLLLAASRRES